MKEGASKGATISLQLGRRKDAERKKGRVVGRGRAVSAGEEKV